MISVTEAARNFSDCISRVRYQQMSFVLVKNGKAVARLVPAADKSSTGQELAEALTGSELSPEQAREWHRDLRSAHEILNSPEDKWE